MSDTLAQQGTRLHWFSMGIGSWRRIGAVLCMIAKGLPPENGAEVFAIMENPGLQTQAHRPSRSRSLRPGLTSSMMLIKLAP
ncbi:MAG TPA: hypothetical protein VKU77_22650 [Streptosporangiaceae bacterium]|nr:hypothetical protein [Streptosporangiaceae bacterium]